MLHGSLKKLCLGTLLAVCRIDAHDSNSSMQFNLSVKLFNPQHYVVTMELIPLLFYGVDVMLSWLNRCNQERRNIIHGYQHDDLDIYLRGMPRCT